MDIYSAKCKFSELKREYYNIPWYKFRKRMIVKKKAKILYKREGLCFKDLKLNIMQKKHKIIMLPTNEKEIGRIMKRNSDNLLSDGGNTLFFGKIKTSILSLMKRLKREIGTTHQAKEVLSNVLRKYLS